MSDTKPFEVVRIVRTLSHKHVAFGTYSGQAPFLVLYYMGPNQVPSESSWTPHVAKAGLYSPVQASKKIEGGDPKVAEECNILSTKFYDPPQIEFVGRFTE